ncbi:MAG: sugar phosphate isomerase/epimerase family protein [Planctomycetota bacterium]|jgi:inosose dehydratase
MGEVELAFHASAWPDDEFVQGLAGISRAGFQAMEARANVVPEYEDRVLVFQEMLAQQRVTLAAVETGLRPITLEILEEEVERCANVARFLRANGAELLVLYPPLRRPEGDDVEDLKLAFEAVNQVGRRTLDLDVRTCVHPEYGTIAETRREVDRLLSATESEFVRLCADVGFIKWSGMSSSSFFKKYGSRIDYVQFRDIRKREARKGRPQAPRSGVFGRGVVNLKTMAKQIESTGYSGWITLECPGKHDDPVAMAANAREVARDILKLA